MTKANLVAILISKAIETQRYVIPMLGLDQTTPKEQMLAPH